MAYIVRGSCNQCGQCCGIDNGVPAFPFSFFQVVKQYQDSPDADVMSLPEAKRNLYILTANAWDIPRVIRIGNKNFDFMIKTGKGGGLVKSSTETYCPFLKDTGAIHPCQVWDEKWCAELCHGAFPNLDDIVQDGEVNKQNFFSKHSNCGYYLEAL